VTAISAYLIDSADVFTPGYSVAYGRIGAQDAALRWVPRPEDSGWDNNTGFEHETSVLLDVDKGVWAREVASRSTGFAQWIAPTPRTFAVRRDLLSLCGAP
jgi:hypothetical protein